MWPEVCTGISEVTGGMDLNNLRPVDQCPKRTYPALFIQAVDDELVPIEHSEMLL